MEIYTVSFFGHRRLENSRAVEHKLEDIVSDLLRKMDYVEFLVGRDGDFDLLAASVVKRCKREIGGNNCSLVWIMPYLTAGYRNQEEAYRSYYDDVEVSQKAAGTYFKTALQIRNREMVARSAFVIFYVEHKSGGAYQTLCYAQKQGVPYVNIWEELV